MPDMRRRQQVGKREYPEQSGDGIEWGCGEKQAYQQVSLRNVRVPRQRMRIQSQGLA